MNSERPGPGLVKSKRAPLIERRARDWIRCTDYHWRELFEKADVVSEGAIRRDNDGPTYYGSTHIRITDTLHEAVQSTSDLALIHRLIRIDPHVRLRAIRIACLEAQVRSSSDLTAIRTEVCFLDAAEAVCISVDIEAKLATNSVIGHRRAAGHRPR